MIRDSIEKVKQIEPVELHELQEEKSFNDTVYILHEKVVNPLLKESVKRILSHISY